MTKKFSYKTRKNIAYLREYNIWIFFVISAIILLLPMLFTLRWTWLPDLTSTGQIGDTIGGITAPFVNIGAAFLLYFTLVAQIKANKIQGKELLRQKRHEQSQRKYDSFMREIESIRQDVGIFVFSGSPNLVGLAAFNEFTKKIEENEKDIAFIKTELETREFLYLNSILYNFRFNWNEIALSDLDNETMGMLRSKLAWFYMGKMHINVGVIASVLKKVELDLETNGFSLIEASDKISKDILDFATNRRKPENKP